MTLFDFEGDDVEVEPRPPLCRYLAAQGTAFATLVAFLVILVLAVAALVGACVSDVPGLAWLAALVTRPFVA
ncbi:hypothetical protein [Couchioplanes azureus]|uniref:hypothetical protein n=1 Tax=Couchioplanes caeruleus TaxID=56438 RepID=UPI0016712217|nr:hypothetical protein [Couchioplanes caeruleus]GGQ52275.1 hypothetical protein GCM10010166_21550 [Couchioplanes caeruleus subsp. azureus]